MKYDSKAPKELIQIQEWFGSIISQPIDDESHISPTTPSGNSISVEASKYITPSPTLKPEDRIELYNQQYWWRFYKVMQNFYPVLVRLFGAYDFNHLIVKPYICKYRPNHWSLNPLGDRLVKWIENDYKGKDKPLVLDIAKIEYAFNTAFFCAHYDTPFESQETDYLLNARLTLQPHVYLFEFNYNLFTLRSEFLKEEEDYWIEHEFPSLTEKDPSGYVLYRNKRNYVTVEKISLNQYRFLKQFTKPNSINKACQWLEKQEDSLVEEASANLQSWLQSWIINKWIYPIKK